MKGYAIGLFAVLAVSPALGMSGWARFGQVLGDSDRSQRVYEERLRENAELEAATLAARNSRLNAEIAYELRSAWQTLGLSEQEANSMVAGFEVQTTVLATLSVVRQNGWRWGVEKALELRGDLDTGRANEALIAALRVYDEEVRAGAGSGAPDVVRTPGSEDRSTMTEWEDASASSPDGVTAVREAAPFVARWAADNSCDLGAFVGDRAEGTEVFMATCDGTETFVECSTHECWVQ